MEEYQSPPEIPILTLKKTKQSREDQESVLSFVSEEKSVLIIYPKLTYEPFQNIYRLARYDNHIFVTTGGRSITLWSKVSMHPEKSFPLDYPSYALCTFNEKGQE